MRQIVCEDCRKRYDYDKEEFCPRCGAFNQPVKTWGVDSRGNVVRVDGVNERNHSGSFVHSEVHSEKARRRRTGLDWTPPRPAENPRPKNGPQQTNGLVQLILWLVVALVAVNFFLPLLYRIFSVF